ncbi:MAG: hypothetical protein ABF904_02860 [Ethanoligenens sp.]
MTVRRAGRVAAVILNFRDNENTLRLVKTLQGCGEIGCICVVDNSETGGLTGQEEPLQAENVLFRKTTNEGYSKGNNLGISAVESQYGLPDFFMVANPDIEIDCASVECCVRLLQSVPAIALAAPRMLRADGTFHDLPGWCRRTVRGDLAYSSGILARLLGMRREAYPTSYWDEMPFVRVDCVAGACFFIRAKAFKTCGYFDEHSFLFYEEDMLGEKLHRMGLGEAVCTGCTYRHLEGVSTQVSLQKYRIMQHSRIYFHRVYRHAGAAALLVLYAATALGICENVLKRIVSALHFKK